MTQTLKPVKRYECSLRDARGVEFLQHSEGTGTPRRQKCAACGGTLVIRTGFWGTFVWNAANRYPAESAKGTYARLGVADRSASRDGNLVVRWIDVNDAPSGMQSTEQASDLHTCTPTGKALPFGRKAPVGQCARCDALRDGAEPKSWGGQSATLRAHNARMDSAARRAHFAPGGPHAQGACGPVCTAFDS